jgi:hypothetical protein
VRASGDTDYTYVKMVYDASALKLPECPTQEKLEELGLVPPPAPAAKLGAAKAPGSAPAAQQGGQQEELEEAPIRTLGDSRLAAAIAQLTGEAPPPMRAEAITAGAARRLQGQRPMTLLPPRPIGGAPAKMVNGLLANQAGRDPFAGIISKPTTTTSGVSVVREQYVAPTNYGTAPSITLTFFFGMTANKTFAYGKAYNVAVPADGLKFNIEAANW